MLDKGEGRGCHPPSGSSGGAGRPFAGSSVLRYQQWGKSRLRWSPQVPFCLPLVSKTDTGHSLISSRFYTAFHRVFFKWPSKIDTKICQQVGCTELIFFQIIFMIITSLCIYMYLNHIQLINESITGKSSTWHITDEWADKTPVVSILSILGIVV